MHIKHLKTTSASSEKEIALKGVSVAFLKEGDTLQGVLIEDTDGTQIQIKAVGQYSNAVVVLIPAKPKMKPVFALKATVLGQPFERKFQDERTARNAQREMMDQMPNSGAVVEAAEALAEDVALIDDSIPF